MVDDVGSRADLDLAHVVHVVTAPMITNSNMHTCFCQINLQVVLLHG